MSEEQLTGLALIHIHCNLDMDINKVINEFDATGHMQIALVIPAFFFIKKGILILYQSRSIVHLSVRHVSCKYISS